MDIESILCSDISFEVGKDGFYFVVCVLFYWNGGELVI